MLKHRALVVVCLGFLAGIVSAIYLSVSLAVFACAALLGLVLVALDARLAAVGVVIASFGVAALRTDLYTQRSASDISHFAPAGDVILAGEIVGEPIRHPASTSFVLACSTVDDDDIARAVTGRVWTTVGTYGTESALPLRDGDRLSVEATLALPRGASNPDSFSWATYLSHRAIWCDGHVRRLSSIHVLAPSNGLNFADFAWSVRERLLAGLSQALPARDFAVLSGVLFGMRGDITPRQMRGFVATGAVHILATAGLHVGVIVMLLRWIGFGIGAPRKATAIASIGLLWMYDIMAGGRPAVTRAVIVATIYLGATIFERTPDVLTSLAAGALFILFLQPTALLEPGFQMSFLTVLTLVSLMPAWQYVFEPLREKLQYKQRRTAGFAIDLVGMCVLAQIGAAPIVATEFHILPLLSVSANLAVVPIVFVLIPCGLFVAALSTASPAIAGAVAHFTVSPLISVVLWVTGRLGDGPAAAIPVGDISPWLLCGYYILLCGGGLVWQEKLAEYKRRLVHTAADAADPAFVRSA